jgi:hypothetical protein
LFDSYSRITRHRVHERERATRAAPVEDTIALSVALNLPGSRSTASLNLVSEQSVQLQLDEAGLAANLPRPSNAQDHIQDVPYRPVQFSDDDLATALERAAAWLRRVQQWLGEPVDVIAIHLDYNDRAGDPYYEVKLLCNDEDLAGAPVALRQSTQGS